MNDFFMNLDKWFLENASQLRLKLFSFVNFGSNPSSCTQRDKSSFLDLSLFLFFRFTLLNWAILSKMGLISAVRTFLFSN